jgi:hypothetical protein
MPSFACSLSHSERRPAQNAVPESRPRYAAFAEFPEYEQAYVVTLPSLIRFADHHADGGHRLKAQLFFTSSSRSFHLASILTRDLLCRESPVGRMECGVGYPGPYPIASLSDGLEAGRWVPAGQPPRLEVEAVVASFSVTRGHCVGSGMLDDAVARGARRVRPDSPFDDRGRITVRRHEFLNQFIKRHVRASQPSQVSSANGTIYALRKVVLQAHPGCWDHGSM